MLELLEISWWNHDNHVESITTLVSLLSKFDTQLTPNPRPPTPWRQHCYLEVQMTWIQLEDSSTLTTTFQSFAGVTWPIWPIWPIECHRNLHWNHGLVPSHTTRQCPCLQTSPEDLEWHEWRETSIQNSPLWGWFGWFPKPNSHYSSDITLRSSLIQVIYWNVLSKTIFTIYSPYVQQIFIHSDTFTIKHSSGPTLLQLLCAAADAFETLQITFHGGHLAMLGLGDELSIFGDKRWRKIEGTMEPEIDASKHPSSVARLPQTAAIPVSADN